MLILHESFGPRARALSASFCFRFILFRVTGLLIQAVLPPDEVLNHDEEARVTTTSVHNHRAGLALEAGLGGGERRGGSEEGGDRRAVTDAIHHGPCLPAAYCPRHPLVHHGDCKDCGPLRTGLCSGGLGAAVQTITVTPAKPSVGSRSGSAPHLSRPPAFPACPACLWALGG